MASTGRPLPSQGAPPDSVEGALQRGRRAFVDLHCHTSASFDSLAAPAAVARAAAARGLTHLAVTDHDTIDGALRARDAAPAGLTVLVGQEIRTTMGDLVAVFLERPVARGLEPAQAVAAVREQGGLVGLPHPFDRFRGSIGRRPEALAAVAGLVDWIEVHNARLVGGGNARAAAFADEAGRPGVAVSDAHTTLEVGVAYSILEADPGTPAGLLAGLPPVEVVTGRASYVVRLVTPLARAVRRLRSAGPAGDPG